MAAPLPPGTVLADRFRLLVPIGRGGFAIAYKAEDLQRGDLCVIKELAPAEAARRSDGVIDLGARDLRLQQRFLEEARLLQRLNIEGILPVRAAFSELGTAYYATDFVEGAETLEELIDREGPMNADGALDLIYQLMETLEALHAKGILHRDVKPSNVLISPDGRAYLIDFGAAREWHADAAVHHTVLYTPGYAPLEQLAEKAKRGPATDIYALCATAYRMLTGQAPPPAADRAAGAPLNSLRELRPDIESSVAQAIEAGLALRYTDRPQSVQALREIGASGGVAKSLLTLQELDDIVAKLQRFSFDKRSCPSCGGVLQEARPLKQGVCPVCREGLIRRRNVSPKLCPACRAGTLIKRNNEIPLAYCPLCKTGELTARRTSLLKKAWKLACASCKAEFTGDASEMSHGEDSRTWDEWRELSGRPTEVWQCDGCHAQYDPLPDGRRRQVKPRPQQYEALYPQEWALVAARLNPADGDAECDSCGADYVTDDDRLALLKTTDDPYGFAKRHRGRLIHKEDLRWIGVGKESPQPGLVCESCLTEFDHDGDFLRLVKTEDLRLVRLAGEAKGLQDWHRLGRGLPTVDQEPDFLAQLPTAVTSAYEAGEIGFGKGLAWSGEAQRLDQDGQTGVLTISDTEITFGSRFRKWRAPIDALVGVNAVGDELHLQFSGESEPQAWELDRVELTAHLRSGAVSVELNAQNLVNRLTTTSRDLPDASMAPLAD